MRIILSAFFGFFTLLCSAQEFEINGHVKGPKNLALPAATVYIETVADTTLVTYTITDTDGSFQLKGTSKAKRINLFISYKGFGTYKKQLLLNRLEINLGTIEMKPQANTLSEVTITATRAPVVIKSDTLQFNADSFNTKENAVLEDLLEKLPGVKIDSEGNITVNGKPVNKILVNGEEFFGGDPKIATKNLPKEIIDKIQVVNTKSEKQEFTGEAGDPDNKTINIKIKEDMNKGFFSRLTAAGGTDERYVLSGIGNYFDGDFRISLLGGMNNINESGFSSSELWELIGSSAFNFQRIGAGRFIASAGIFSGGNGVTESKAAGLNITNKWGETTELGGTYLYGHKNTDKKSEVHRENILSDKRYFTNSRFSSNEVNDYHKVDLDFEINPDTLTRISISPHLRVNTGLSTSNSFLESLDNSGNRINNSQTSAYADFENKNFSNRLNIIRKFGGNGAYLSLNFNNNHTLSANDQYFYSEKTIFDPNSSTTTTEEQKQSIAYEQKKNNYDLGLTSRSVLAKNFFLDLSYDLNLESGNSTRNVFDFDQAAQDYTHFNQNLSNDFEYKSVEHIPNVGLNYEGEKMRASFDAGLSNLSLESVNKIADVSFKNTYNSLYLRSYFRYKIKRSANIYARYSRFTDVPSLKQLQPVIDQTNPLNIVTGNPNLEPIFRQRIRVGYRNYDFASRSGIYTFASVNFTDNNVVPVTTVDNNLVRHTTYTNVDGTYRINLGGSFDKQVKKETRIFKYGFSLWGGQNHNVAFSNAEKFESDSYYFYPGIELGYEIEDIFSLSTDYGLNYTMSRYDIFDNREESYTSYSVGLNLETYWPENIIFETEIDYAYDGNVRKSYDPSSVLWNASLGYQFWGDKAVVSLKAYDLLEQNNRISHAVGDDYIQDSKRLVIDRYFLLSFTYKFTKFGGKDPSEGGRW